MLGLKERTGLGEAQFGGRAAFLRSMPKGYSEAFSEDAYFEHARIAARRGKKPFHVEVWRQLDQGVAVLCVIADDRPGVLGHVAATLVRQGMDVQSALIYSRERDGLPKEAVDFFWVRRAASLGPLTTVERADAERIAAVLCENHAASLPPPDEQPEPSSHGAAQELVQVHFEGPNGTEVEDLSIEAPDLPGLLLAVVHALVTHRLSIENSECKTTAGRALDRFSVRAEDGRPLNDEKRTEIVRAVRRAILRLLRSTS